MLKVNNKVKKMFCLLIITSLFLFIWFGYIYTPQKFVLWHFNQCKQSFQNIVYYSKANGLEIDKDEYLVNPQKYPEISADLHKVFVQGNYCCIWGSEVITFQTSSLYTPKGGVYAVVYSDYPMKNQIFYDNHEMSQDETTYESLGEGWYVEYRK